jgi:hypothetical protein
MWGPIMLSATFPGTVFFGCYKYLYNSAGNFSVTATSFAATPASISAVPGGFLEQQNTPIS